ncbi:hypothetical protein KBI23_19735 [bacterium]|nr:hypothetical protein [bacterium]MBP9808501.1 hypothetical protein [bacterium]
MNSYLITTTEKSTCKRQLSEEYIAANNLTPVSTLAILSKSSKLEIKLAVAENRSTSLCTLLEMARNDDADLRFSMAENANLPIAVLTLLSEDDNPYISCRAERTLCLIRKGRKTAETNVISITSTARGAANRGFRRFIQTLTRIAKVC